MKFKQFFLLLLSTHSGNHFPIFFILLTSSGILFLLLLFQLLFQFDGHQTEGAPFGVVLRIQPRIGGGRTCPSLMMVGRRITLFPIVGHRRQQFLILAQQNLSLLLVVTLAQSSLLEQIINSFVGCQQTL